MGSGQEPSPLKGSKHSLQRHPHDTALMNELSFVSMGVEARCRPCHSAAYCRHMKRQPSLCHCCPCHGRCHCNLICHLHCHHQLCCHCPCHRHGRCHSQHRCPLLLPLSSAIAVTVAIAHCHCHLCPIAGSHFCCRCPCCCPLPSPSPLAIAVAISVGHHRCRPHRPLPRVVALAWQELYSNNLSKEGLPYFILFGQWAAHCSKQDD